MASMSACRLLPRPEIRTPIAGVVSGIDHAFAAGADITDAHRVCFTSLSERRDELAFPIRRAREDEAYTHVEGPKHIGIGNVASALQPFEHCRRPPRRSHDPRMCASR